MSDLIQHDTFDSFAKANGFENEREFHYLVSHADLSTPEKLAQFMHWQDEDGTKQGLLLLPRKEKEGN